MGLHHRATGCGGWRAQLEPAIKFSPPKPATGRAQHPSSLRAMGLGCWKPLPRISDQPKEIEGEKAPCPQPLNRPAGCPVINKPSTKAGFACASQIEARSLIPLEKKPDPQRARRHLDAGGPAQGPPMLAGARASPRPSSMGAITPMSEPGNNPGQAGRQLLVQTRCRCGPQALDSCAQAAERKGVKAGGGVKRKPRFVALCCQA